MEIKMLFIGLFISSLFIAKSIFKKEENETEGMESKIILISYLAFFCLLCAIISYFVFEGNPIIEMLRSGGLKE